MLAAGWGVKEEMGKEEALHVSLPVDASKLGVGSDLGDPFLFFTVNFGSKMMLQRENKQTDFGLSWNQPVQELDQLRDYLAFHLKIARPTNLDNKGGNLGLTSLGLSELEAKTSTSLKTCEGSTKGHSRKSSPQPFSPLWPVL